MEAIRIPLEARESHPHGPDQPLPRSLFDFPPNCPIGLAVFLLFLAVQK